MPDPILVAVYGDYLDDDRRRCGPTLLCVDCADGLDWVRGARSVLLTGGELWFDDDAGGELPVAAGRVCGSCGDALGLAPSARLPQSRAMVDAQSRWDEEIVLDEYVSGLDGTITRRSHHV